MADAYGRAAIVDEIPRCWRCNRILAYFATRPWKISCSRCKALNQAGTEGFQPTYEQTKVE